MFKYFNYLMVFFWRLGLGKLVNIWPGGIGRIMIITNSGRVSGTLFYTPVNYYKEEGVIYCAAGFGDRSDWYLNLIANPIVEIWLPDGWYSGIYEEVTDTTVRLPLLRMVLIASGFAAPLFGINLKSMDDTELEKTCKDYRLIKINRQSEQTGANGPGSLIWFGHLSWFYLCFIN